MQTKWDAADAFAYMADLRNFAQWDPGVGQVTTPDGSRSGLGSTYDVEVRTGVRSMVLRYEVVEWDPPRRLVVSASKTLRSVDEIRIEPASPPGASGTLVTYDAELELLGVMRIANPLLGIVFRRIGDRAAAGLRRVLAADAPQTP